MARTFVEGSGSGPNDHQPTLLSVNDAGSVQLPEGINPGDLDLSRDGQDLVMTAPNGDVFVIENYFAMPDAPMIIGGNGALLTPNLVQSFVSSLNEIEVAAGPQVGNDASPVGEVTEVSGEATVTHTDGSKEKITVGSKIFEGDIIETDDKGAVNIQFADESTFAVSQNARLAVDDFSFNPDDQSGSTGLSILRGVFMFTSGLVGRENPDAVHLETPVGSIGIRGTIIGGEISANGKAQISVIEGAIVVRNGNGEQILSQQFETVQLTGFNAPITNIGTLNAQSMTQSYGAVRAVSPTLFTSIDDTARDQGQQNNQPQQGQQPQSQEAQPEAQPQSQTEAAPQPVAETQPVLQDTPVFQTLSTGSNIDNSLGASAPAATTPAPTAASPAAPTPAPQAPAPVPPQTNAQQPADNPPPAPRDTRPPSSLLFANDLAATGVGEDTLGGTKVATVHQVNNQGFAVTYSLVNNAGGMFTIDPNTGDIFVATGQKTADLDAGAHAPYNIVVRTARADNPTIGTETPLTLNLTPVDEAPVLNAAAVMPINEGASILLGGHISATDPESSANLTYHVVGTPAKGNIYLVGGGSTPITTFTQTQLNNNQVEYRHDGSEPGGAKFTLTVTDQGGNTSAPREYNLNVQNVNDAPTQDNLATPTMLERGTLLLNHTKLSWSDPDSEPGEVEYTLGTQTNGTVEKFVSGFWTAMSSGQKFTQADINAGNKIRFVQNDAESASASFSYTVTDSQSTPTAGTFTTNVALVNDIPVLIDDEEQDVVEGQAVIISNADLDYSDGDNQPDEIVYTILGSPQNGYVQYSNDGGVNWATVASFTQDDIDNNRIRFRHDDSETDVASFSYNVFDGTDTTVTATHEFTVTRVNDAPTNVTLTLSGGGSIEERVSVGAVEVNIGTVTVTDAEGAFNPTDHTLVVQRFNGSGYVDDARFAVLDNGSGGWKIVAEANTAFNHEGEPSIQLRVKLTDGSNSDIYSAPVNLTVTDVNEAPDDFFMNEGRVFSGSADLLVSGKQENPIVAIIGNNDPDSDPTFQLNAGRYQITNVTGGLSVSDFSIVNVTDDHGHVRQALKFNKPSGYTFADGGTSFTITVKMDATQNGFDAGDVTHTFSVIGRNDAMVVETLNGSNGFKILNDSRFGGVGFGGGLSMGDLDGDGKIDLVFGAPKALNGTGEVTGGLYAFGNNAGLKTDSLDGEVFLRTITGVGTAPYTDPGEYNPGSDSVTGHFHELDNGNDGHRYGARMTYLSNFDGKATKGGDIAIVNAATDGAPNMGTVRILSGLNMLDATAGNDVIATVINVYNGGKTGDELIGSITVSSLGDINGDGVADLFVGAQYDGVSESGRGMVVFGSPTLSGEVDFSTGSGQLVLDPGSSGDRFGKEAAGLGDVNGDGYNDYIVSSGGGNGKAYVYFGNLNGDAGTPLIITGTASNKLTPQVSAAGDFNGDGLNDFMIRSEPTADGTQGAVKIVYGNTGLDGYTSFTTDQFTNTGFTGVNIHWNVADSAIRVGNIFTSAGDFNADGFDDVVIDVSRNLGSGSYEHTLFVVYGTESSATINLNSIMAGATAGDANKAYKIRLLEPTGEHISVASAGDINGDGFDDLTISNPGAHGPGGGNHDGAAYVVYGGDYNGVGMTKMTGVTPYIVASGNSQIYLGDTANNTLENGVSAASMTFNAGGGDDTYRVSSAAAANFRAFDGGSGRDTLKLFFSSGENSANAPGTLGDDISLFGVGNKMSGVEVIAFDQTSYEDKIKLKISDVLSLMSTSDTGSLTILSLEMLEAANHANKLAVYENDGTTAILDLYNFGFTKNGDGVAGQDQVSLTSAGGTGTGYVYTHSETGFQLIVDSRIAGAGTMASQ